MPRSYTVTELDDLRQCVRNKRWYGSYRGPKVPEGWGGGMIVYNPYQEVDLVKIIEEEVRTHMIAGHTADDLRNIG